VSGFPSANCEPAQACTNVASELSNIERAGLWLVAVGAFLVAVSFLWQGSLGGLGGRPVGRGGTRNDRAVYAVGLCSALLVAAGSVIVAVTAFPPLWVAAATVGGVLVAVWLFAAWRLRVDSRKNRDEVRRAAEPASALAEGWRWDARRYDRQREWRRCLKNPFISEESARQQAGEAFGPRPVPFDDRTS